MGYTGARNRGRLTFLVVAVVVATLVADTSLIRIYSFNSSNPSLSAVRIAAFTAIVTVYVVAQYFILEFVRVSGVGIRSKAQLHLRFLHRTVTIIQYVLAAVL